MEAKGGGEEGERREREGRRKRGREGEERKGGGREEPREEEEADLALLGILVGVALAMQVAVEHGPRQLAGVALHLEILGRLLGDKQEVLNAR